MAPSRGVAALCLAIAVAGLVSVVECQGLIEQCWKLEQSGVSEIPIAKPCSSLFAELILVDHATSDAQSVGYLYSVCIKRLPIEVAPLRIRREQGISDEMFLEVTRGLFKPRIRPTLGFLASSLLSLQIAHCGRDIGRYRYLLSHGRAIVLQGNYVASLTPSLGSYVKSVTSTGLSRPTQALLLISIERRRSYHCQPLMAA